MYRMRVLGIDYGRARIGVAVSDPTGLFAQGLTVIPRRTDEAAAAEIARIAREQAAELIVVGLPRRMDGSLGERAAQCQAFAERVASAAGLPVDLYDERLTTVSAERTLIDADVGRARRRQVVDKLAAALMLQGWLDSRRKRATDDGSGS
ncbi:Holliday junction resolvase RuvX [Alicyclobacillus kakegawensis]|uniref:Holliday junction resolvase RuvX n=1 Tax=Alicyclobacillus kakegawensis TaxID=392012 RepID=UPI0034E1C816